MYAVGWQEPLVGERSNNKYGHERMRFSMRRTKEGRSLLLLMATTTTTTTRRRRRRTRTTYIIFSRGNLQQETLLPMFYETTHHQLIEHLRDKNYHPVQEPSQEPLPHFLYLHKSALLEQHLVIEECVFQYQQQHRRYKVLLLYSVVKRHNI